MSLLLIGQQGLGHFFSYRHLLPIGWRTVQIVRQRRKKMANTAPTTLSVKQAENQSTFINENYAPLVICKNDKNKQLTFCSSGFLQSFFQRNALRYSSCRFLSFFS
jgi:hypothetical protein